MIESAKPSAQLCRWAHSFKETFRSRITFVYRCGGSTKFVVLDIYSLAFETLIGGKAMRILNILAGRFSMCACLFAAALMLFSLPVYAGVGVDGFDTPGFDYDNFSASSAFVCRNTCGGDSRCQAWTWVKPGIQEQSGHCWLKDRQPDLVKNTCCVSGPRKFIEKVDVKAEDSIDRPGLDYQNFVTDSWENCEATCAGD
jgi:PAN domain